MKVAVVLHGNLRTFFMPLREGRQRVCDLVRQNVVEPNRADLFMVTDTTDFYWDGTHYFDDRQAGEIASRDTGSSMFHANVALMPAHKSKDLISAELNGFFGNMVKSLQVQDFDSPPDPRIEPIAEALAQDMSLAPIYAPIGRRRLERLFAQYGKIKSAYESMVEHEGVVGGYDLVFRGRFDNMYGPLDVSSYDFNAFDVYAPGVVRESSGGVEWGLVYDWCAFGTRPAMGLAMSLYDRLGFTMANRLYRCGCSAVHCGQVASCPCGDPRCEDMTISSEYHLYRLFKDNNVRCGPSGRPMSPYRFR